MVFMDKIAAKYLWSAPCAVREAPQAFPVITAIRIVKVVLGKLAVFNNTILAKKPDSLVPAVMDIAVSYCHMLGSGIGDKSSSDVRRNFKAVKRHITTRILPGCIQSSVIGLRVHHHNAFSLISLNSDRARSIPDINHYLLIVYSLLTQMSSCERALTPF